MVATTTPRDVPLLRRILEENADSELVVTRGSTFDNAANLPPRFVSAMRGTFGQSLLGRQELDGELLLDREGALWTRALLEACRAPSVPSPPRRTVIGVDPPASADGDACGIVVCALGEDGLARVLADASVEKARPERWARAVAETARAWQADRVVAEANQGGAMVGSCRPISRLSQALVARLDAWSHLAISSHQAWLCWGPRSESGSAAE